MINILTTKLLHLTFLYYFWISVFDKILLENIPYGWFSRWAERIKVILLTAVLLMSILFYGYKELKVNYLITKITTKALENDFEDIFENLGSLSIIEVK